MMTLGACGLDRPGVSRIGGVPEGYDALWLAGIARDAGTTGAGPVIYVARDDARMQRVAEGLSFFAADIRRIVLPAWDCLPFDRVSPRADIVSQRLSALGDLLKLGEGPTVLFTTVNAMLQRVPPRAELERAAFGVATGKRTVPEDLIGFLENNGYTRAGTVMEAGEYASRGGLLDVFPTGAEEPLRIDLFGDEVESIKTFDPLTQRSIESVESFEIGPVSEAPLNETSIEQFKAGYRTQFGAVTAIDPLFEAVSAGRRYPGMEHWLPLFHDTLETVFDYVPAGPVILDHMAEQARDDRFEAIADYYQARTAAASGAAGQGGLDSATYHALPPETLYLDSDALAASLAGRAVGICVPFTEGDSDQQVSVDARPARDFAAERKRGTEYLYGALAAHISSAHKAGHTVLIAAWSAGTRERLRRLLDENEIGPCQVIEGWADVAALPKGISGLVVLPLERGFKGSSLSVIAEQDILGSRLNRGQKRRRIRAETFIADTSEIADGDFVVHVDHGIGRYDGLITVEVGDAPHDCLRLIYDGGDKLFLPVEHIDLLSRYGAADKVVSLDKLGGVSWQARKSRLKKRVREMADELIRTAAARLTHEAPVLEVDAGAYEAFCAGFPYVETDDQATAINETLSDLGAGTPMDRLICGDVGFGKTEVALRAAFTVAMAGKQVAVLVPTTLLARQHYANFVERFKTLPVKIAQLSRLVAGKAASEIKEGLAEGDIDIVIGTHALLAKSVQFSDLGLVIIDEEQHFGVAHKERLKTLQADVHVLTLTATPIPRTLQMSLAGVRGMSIIATPPVDRLAVRTFVMPHDPVVVREAILREQMRGGQTFYVCPRVADLERVSERVRNLVPEVRVATAHGQMGAKALEDTMVAFFDGEYDVLVSTAIIESGLDVPRVNTMIVHRADMFGLAQLYQLRGRIGRSKLRGYAYLTLPPDRRLTDTAYKRLEVIHRLDSLGAGFSLASHDLDIRGAGNLLGAEQSGQIREVGIELYQHMLEEAIAEARAIADGGLAPQAETWSPSINIGTAILIPERYVQDLDVRLGLYRRIARLEGQEQTEAVIEELTDRFGPPPDEVLHLLDVVAIKRLCREAGVEKVDAGPKGAVLAFRDATFAAPDKLIAYVSDPGRGIRVRPDSRLVINRNWVRSQDRLSGIRRILGDLGEMLAHV